MRFRRHKIRGLIDKIDPTFLEMNTQSLVIMRHFRVTLSVVVYLEDLYGYKVYNNYVDMFGNISKDFKRRLNNLIMSPSKINT